MLLAEECPEDEAAAGEESRTRLYPVEISRALKSSESMLPVCFCSGAQPQRRRSGAQDSGSSKETEARETR